MKNKTILLWVLVILAVLAIIGYNQGWFKKKEVVPPCDSLGLDPGQIEQLKAKGGCK